TQTGGGCRASNYIHLLRKALIKAGYEYIPVISLNMSGLESNPGFSITVPMLRKAVAAVVYGDCLMHLHNQIKPYAVNKDDCDKLLNHLSDGIADMLNDGHGYSLKEMTPILAGIAKSYSEVKTDGKKRIKVGVVGEIYVKYAPLGNNNLEEFLASQDCEYMLPGIMGFALFKVDNRLEDIHLYGGNPVKYAGVKVLMDYLTKMESAMINAIKVYPQFCPPTPYTHIKTLVKGVVGYGSKMGEGWLLTAEMLELAENGYENIVCTQPFGCLPNHINGKGMIRKIKEKNSRANIVPIDYDPSATRVNQENRIKLMLAVAKEQMEN
ncbi:MAG: 2-hydroxyglutaryl-CoA dehydratase, partial [Oscillospiraceae bacterium]